MKRIYDNKSWLDALLSEKRKVLDLGCGSGRFLSAARERGIEVKGYEISEQRVKEADHPSIVLADVNTLPELGSGYDLITMFHFIEHLENPKAILSVIYKSLISGGVIVVETPNADAQRGIRNHSRITHYYQQSKIAHKYIFVKTSLEYLLYQVGFRNIKTFSYGGLTKYVPFDIGKKKANLVTIAEKQIK